MTAIVGYTGCSAPVMPFMETVITTHPDGPPGVRVPLNAAVALSFTEPTEVKNLVLTLLTAHDALVAAIASLAVGPAAAYEADMEASP